jgi:hypothetical protein
MTEAVDHEKHINGKGQSAYIPQSHKIQTISNVIQKHANAGKDPQIQGRHCIPPFFRIDLSPIIARNLKKSIFQAFWISGI